MDRIDNLYFRRTICNMVIKELHTLDDPRKPDALEFYKKQLSDIDSEITKLEKEKRIILGIPEPEPVVVGVKSAIILGNTK